MSILNLTDRFEPFGSSSIEFQKFVFPSGMEQHIKIRGKGFREILITSRIQNMGDLMTILLTNDALRRMDVWKVNLFIPYLPFARQDRVMVKGEPLSLKVIADVLNLQKFDNVKFFDAHSDVALAVIDKSESISNHSFVYSVLEHRDDYIIACPDAGAFKKIFKLCQFLGYQKDIAVCNKTRNVETGEITSITCDKSDFNGQDVFIIDDICDGGGTFVLLANELRKRNVGKINLIVSHGIFSKGDVLENIDHIYTTDSFKYMPSHDKLTQIKLKIN